MLYLNNVSVVKIIFSTPASCIFVGDYNGTKFTCKSPYNVKKGDIVNIEGEWIYTDKYGFQFKAYSIQKSSEQTIENAKEFLKNFKGIGEKNAQKIVNHFQNKIWQILEEKTEEIKKVVKVSDETIEEIKKYFRDKNFISLFSKYQFSPNLINKIAQKYCSIEQLKEHIYDLVFDFDLNFFDIDEIARKEFGYKLNDFRRTSTLTLYFLQYNAENQGHTFAYFSQLQKQCEKFHINFRTFLENLWLLLLQQRVVITDQDLNDTESAIFLPKYYYAEYNVARMIRNLLAHPFIYPTPTVNDVEGIINQVTSKLKINYSDQQQEAIKKAITEKVFILTGGPGTGKTTTIKGILEALKTAYPDAKIVLASPTGKAAKRMEETTKYPASTMHRLLEFRPNNNELICLRNENNPIEADIVIIDEASMIDILTFHSFLKAIKPTTKLIIVGDTNQLPSVGAGNVLGDLIESQIVPVIRLTNIFRQGQDSLIVKNAYKIMQGENVEYDDKEFVLIPANPQNIAQTVLKLYTQYQDVIVLSPFKRKTMNSTFSINQIIQQNLNPSTESLQIKNVLFKLNDLVIQTKNNYEKQVFNGDIGRITAINKEQLSIVVKFEDREVTYTGKDEIEELELAYALTVHKSQGSEYDTVIIVASMEHKPLLFQNLIYTAVTRAKKKVIIVGDKKAIEYASKHRITFKRNTKLYFYLSQNQ